MIEKIKEFILIYDPLYFVKNIVLLNELMYIVIILFLLILLLSILLLIENIFSYFNNLITKPILSILRNGFENTIKNVEIKTILKVFFGFSIFNTILLFGVLSSIVIGVGYFMEKNTDLMTNERQKIANMFTTPIRDEVVELFNNGKEKSSLELKEQLWYLYMKEKELLNNDLKEKYTSFINNEYKLEEDILFDNRLAPELNIHSQDNQDIATQLNNGITKELEVEVEYE